MVPEKGVIENSWKSAIGGLVKLAKMNMDNYAYEDQPARRLAKDFDKHNKYFLKKSIKFLKLIKRNI